MRSRDPRMGSARRRGANQNVLYVLAALMLVAGAALIILKTRAPGSGSPSPKSSPESTPTSSTSEESRGGDGPVPEAAGSGDVEADLRALFVSAKAAYKAFGEAERAGEETARLRNFKQAKAMLEAFMEKAGAAEGEAAGMIREAQQMLSDLTKRARTSD